MSLSQSDIDAVLTETAASPQDDGVVSSPTGETASRNPNVNRILGMSVPLTVKLAEREMTVEAILEFSVGTIVEFEVPFDYELMLEVAGQTIGYGQAVKVGEKFGLRVSRIGTVAQRINALAGSSNS